MSILKHICSVLYTLWFYKSILLMRFIDVCEQPACVCLKEVFHNIVQRFTRIHLTRSAYFLHKAANFSSGVARELSACINRTTSFPETNSKIRTDRLMFFPYNFLFRSWDATFITQSAYSQVVLELLEEEVYQCNFAVFCIKLLFCNNLILRM